MRSTSRLASQNHGEGLAACVPEFEDNLGTRAFEDKKEREAPVVKDVPESRIKQ